MKAWTDYTFTELGDRIGHESPIRVVEVLTFDLHKRCRIIVEGLETMVKRGYLYRRPGRCGNARNISVQSLRTEYGSPKYVWQAEKVRRKETYYQLDMDGEPVYNADSRLRRFESVAAVRIYVSAHPGHYHVYRDKSSHGANGCNGDCTLWAEYVREPVPRFSTRVLKRRKGRK